MLLRIFFDLNFRFRQRDTAAFLSNFDKSRSLQLIVGRPSRSADVTFEISVARKCSPSSAKPYSLPHCLLIDSATDEHNWSIITFPISVDNSGTGIPRILTTNFSNVSVFFSGRSLYSFGIIFTNSSSRNLNTVKKWEGHKMVAICKALKFHQK